jgi:hypothetical protein
MQPETLEAWLNAPNEEFDGKTPAEVIEYADRLWRMVYFLNSGVPS